jgi:hypothetical protein
MTSNFSIIQQPNNTYILKYDMGTTCYQGLINQNNFPEELKVNYIEVVNEAIQYFLKESEKDTKIVSMLQHSNSADVNYFLISFQKNDQYVKYQRFISIELNKVIKTVNDYLCEFDQRIVVNKNTLSDLTQKNETQEVEIKTLKETLEKLNERVKKLEEELVNPLIKSTYENFKLQEQQKQHLQQQPQQSNLFNPVPVSTQLPFGQNLQQQHSQQNLFNPVSAQQAEQKKFQNNQPISNIPDFKNFNIQTTVKKKDSNDLALTPNPPSFFTPKATDEQKDKPSSNQTPAFVFK